MYTTNQKHQRFNRKTVKADQFDYDVIIFDCDGVLLDANRLKIDAFRATLESNGFDPKLVSAASTWQSKSFGTSRYRLFAEVLSGRFGEPPGVCLDKLLADFSSACASGYLAVAETPGLRPALCALSLLAHLYVVSGSDEAELRNVLECRGLAGFFVEIFGSPRTKIENIARVRWAQRSRMEKHDRILFIGDAVADLDASRACGCDFAFMVPFSTVKGTMLERAALEGFRVIEEIGELRSS